jgi:hypothetical protein
MDVKEEFWEGVARQLIDEYERSYRAANQGISEYRSRVEENAGETVYNQGEELAARVIDGLMRFDYPQLGDWNR